jgi:RimJ/RimL family protein N-acetyltransferase
VSVRLRPTTEADLDFVLATEQDAHNRRFIGQWSRAEHAAALRSPAFRHFVVEHDGRPVGYVILQDVDRDDRVLQFRRIALAERGRGHGRAALRAARRLAFEELGARRFWLDVKTSNAVARSLYGSEGWREEGLLDPRHHPGHGDDEPMIVMAVYGP